MEDDDDDDDDDDGGGGCFARVFFNCLTRFERVMVGMHSAPWLRDEAIKGCFLF